MPKRKVLKKQKLVISGRRQKSSVWTLGLPEKTTKSARFVGLKMATIWGGDDNESTIRRGGNKPIKRVRNPWIPDDIITLLKFLLVYPAGKGFVEIVKAWMEYRNAKEIEIKVGDNKLQIKGHITEPVLKRRIETFRDLIGETTYEEIEVNLPKGAKRTIPVKLATEKTRNKK